MLRKERYDFILNHFRSALPNVTTELQFGSAFQLLVATLLSAQCTDKRINMVTPALFARYPDAQHMAQASEEDIYELISSVSYPNAKAKHLAEMSRQLGRYAETLLNAAELALQSDPASAKTWLNLVHNRAGLSDTVEATLENIQKERALEFVGEGKRYWDLIRWGLEIGRASCRERV